MIRSFIPRLALIAAAGVALTLGGCVTALTSHPDYVAAGLSAPLVQGRVVLVMDKQLQSQMLTQSPSSYIGAATEIVLPIGLITADVGKKVFGAGFSGGAQVAETQQPGAYGLGLRLDNFSYQYEELSTLGFEIKPEVTVALTVEALAPDGHVLFRKRYERRNYLVGAYVIDLNPAEKINQAVHMALADIFREVLSDVVKAEAAH